MQSKTRSMVGQSCGNFQNRVVQAAEAVLKRSGSIGPLELFQEMRLLQPVHVEGGRKGNEHTNYDELLMRGTEQLDARSRVREQIDRVL